MNDETRAATTGGIAPDLYSTLDARVAEAIPGGAANVQDVYPLSPLQEGMLFHRLLDERGDTYVLSTLLELRSSAYIDVLVNALRKVIDRHDVLRTAVIWEGLPRPLQVVYRNAMISAEILPLDESSDALAQLRERMQPGRQPLDVQRAPVMRLQVAGDCEGPKQYALLQIHHLFCDHQSLRTLIDEVIACIEGHESDLPPPASFKNYVSRAVRELDVEAAEAFFRRKLADIDEPTAPFGVLEVHGGGREIKEARCLIRADDAREIRAQAHGAGVSVARLCHAAWALVVARTSARQDVVFGTVLSDGSRRKESRRMLGMYVNTLPLRLHLEGFTARELVMETSRELEELLQHQNVPLTVAQRSSAVAMGAPLFTSLFNFRRSIDKPICEEQRRGGVRAIERGEAWTNYPLTMIVDDLGEDLLLTAQTDPRIDPDDVLGYFTTAVHSLVTALKSWPETMAVHLQVLPESKAQEVLLDFNATERPFAEEKLIHQLFEDQVARKPDAIAVEYEDQRLTYAELNSRSNQLARHLVALGVRPEQLVGICIERSIEMVVGLLGILKAGAAYVPLDPDYPAERLSNMLEDSRPAVVLTSAGCRSALPDGRFRTIALDGDWREISAHSTVNLDPGALGLTSRNLAYVIFTSGSTGRPKGAMNEHRALINRLGWMQRQYRLDGTDSVLQKTPFSFDVSVWEFFWTLMTGARLVVARPRGHQDPAYLRKIIDASGITTLHFVPSMLQVFLDSHEAGSCASVRRIVCSGEELPATLRDQCHASLPSARLSNLYGPTEAAIDVTFWDCEPGECGNCVPIGRPIANTRMYVLDRYLQPVPIGVAGEIFIGGVNVGRGYFNRPELTAGRFIKDPFDSDSRARLYKTGDLGRWRPDGAIEYLGRNDHQVKIRGLRIELGEIEARLRRHPGVKETVIVAREDVPGEKRLVAYLVGSATAEDLRASLKETLPEHMVPAAFVRLERMPLSPNGKLDRRALPAPEPDALARGEYEVPQGPLEEALASVWQSLLGIDRVGRRDNFFGLGGHSLLIVRMMQHLREVGLSTDVRSVFDHPTLAELAASLVTAHAARVEVPPNLIPPGCEAIEPNMLPLIDLTRSEVDHIVRTIPGGAANIQDIYPLTPAQEGLLFHHVRNQEDGDTYVVATLLSVESRARLDALIQALQSSIDRHDVLRTAVLWEHLSKPLQVVFRRAMLPVEQITLHPEQEILKQVHEWLAPERQQLDLRKPPLLQLRIAADPYSSRWFAMLQLHHIISDNTSQELVISELIRDLAGETIFCKDFPLYREHVAQSLASASDHERDAFFRSKLGDVEEPTAPFNVLDIRPNSIRAEARASLDGKLSNALRAQARRLGVSTATLFHAAWSLVVGRTSARTDVVFGSVLLGRMHHSTAGKPGPGMFVNTLPLRMKLQGVTAEELVRRTQRELIELLAHEQTSLAAAQRCSGIVGSAPLFTSLLNYRHVGTAQQALWDSANGLTVLATHDVTSYPVTVSVDDSGEGFVLSVQTDPRIDARRLIGYMRMALASLADALLHAPQRPVLELEILPSDERRQVIELFNATDADYPCDMLIHELFEEQAARSPAATAVACLDASLTYAALNARANRLARYLRSRGVGPDNFVGLCMERGIDMVVGLLGILKAGGAYVPLDSSYPAERLEYILNDTRPVVVLTQEHLKRRVPGQGSVFALDSGWGEVEQQDAGNLCRSGTSRNLAYIIYTSGSTGQPKGVAIEHRNAVNLICWGRSVCDGSEFERTLFSTSLNFDLSVYECFVPLSVGGALQVVPNAIALSREPADVTLINTVPSAIRALVESGSVPPSVRVVNLAGEALKKELTESIFEHSAVERVVNLYGPSETTTYSTWVEMPRAKGFIGTIGRPLANTQVYILDANREPVPIGVTGEIYIGGAGVARGYLNRVELTAERFLKNPFRAEPGARMYRTGDVGMWHPDGQIEYLGRNDHQVKIRGFRIELGEVESRLARHPAVRDAVVVAREDVPGDKRLVAYVVTRQLPGDVAPPEPKDLQAHLKAALPDHMVPGTFVILERLPLTSNGKVDRRALPAPQTESGHEHEPPQGATEEMLAGLWSELLHVDRPGRNDDFFVLGGHSIVAMQIVARLQRALSLEVPIGLIFEHPTIRTLGVEIEGLLSVRFTEKIAGDDAELQELLETVASMPESEAQAALRQLSMEDGWR